MRRFVALSLALALAGCGGRAGSSLPAIGAAVAQSAQQHPSGTAAAVSGGPVMPTLYVASRSQVSAYALNASGNAQPARTITGPFFRMQESEVSTYLRAIYGISTGTDGSLFVLTSETNDPRPAYRATPPPSTSSCAIAQYAGDATGYAAPIATPACTNAPASGISARPSGAVDYKTLESASGAIRRDTATGAAMTRLTFPAAGVDRNGFAEDSSADVFLTYQNPNRWVEYATNGAAAGPNVARSVSLGPNDYPGPIAVASDGTVYVAVTNPAPDFRSSTDAVQAFAPGASVASRTIGPFTNAVSALTVDRNGNLYVGITERLASSYARVKVYGPDATGNATPIRTLQTPFPGAAYAGGPNFAGRIVGLAVVDPPPHEHVYIGNDSQIDVYPIDATGRPAPERTITGFQDHANDGRRQTHYTSTLGLAVQRHGIVTVDLQWDSIIGSAFELKSYAADANGAAEPIGYISGSGAHNHNSGIAADDYGNIDVLDLDARSIETFSPELNAPTAYPTPMRSLRVGSPKFTTDKNGRVYVYDAHGFTVYPPGAGGQDVPSRSVTVTTNAFEEIDDVAAAPDGTVYAFVKNNDLSTRVLHVCAPGANGTGCPATLTVAYATTGMAVDDEGELVLAQHKPDGSSLVSVFAPGSTGNAVPLRSFAVAHDGYLAVGGP